MRASRGSALPLGVGGISIDTRTLAPGDLFFAIKGDARDGHDFVRAAFERGAAAAVIDEAHAAELSGSGRPLYIVKDTLQALEGLGAHGRARAAAYVAAITGSVGKTTTKEMARAVLSHFGADACFGGLLQQSLGRAADARAHAARHALRRLRDRHEPSPARSPPLVALVQPHVAVITTVAPAHLEHFASVEAIADAKAEIFGGLLEGGVAIINRDDAVFERLLRRRARSRRGACLHLRRDAEARRAPARPMRRRDGTARRRRREILGRSHRYSHRRAGRACGDQLARRSARGPRLRPRSRAAAAAARRLPGLRQAAADARSIADRERRDHA